MGEKMPANDTSKNVTNDPKPWQFKAGNKGGPGNPHAKRVGELKAAIMRAVTEADMVAIFTKAVDDAKAGDRAAREWVYDRVLGKVAQHLEATVESTTLSPEQVRAKLDAVLGLSSSGDQQ